MKLLFLTLLFSFSSSLLISCKSSPLPNHSHTLKLQQGLSVEFIEIDKIKVSFNKNVYTSVKVDLYHQTTEKKTSLFTKTIKSPQILETKITTPKNGFLAAVVKTLDLKNKISSSAVYNIKEQTDLNRIKKNFLKNRN